MPARLIALLTVVGTVGGAALPAAAETIQSDLVLIREGDAVDEDLYAVGNRIDIDGTIRGDLIAAAFGEVRIDGVVDGSVMAIASRVVVTGQVTGSLRTAASEVVIEGDVEGDVATFAARLTAAGTSRVGRDVVAAAWAADLDGAVDRGVEGAFRTLDIGGAVAESVEVSVHDLAVGPAAVVGGDLAYRSSRDGVVDDEATVEGSVLARRPLSPNVRVVGLGVLFRVLLVVFGAALGLAVVWISVPRAEQAAGALRARVLGALATGVGVVAVPVLMVAVLAVITSLAPPESSLPLVLSAVPLLLGVLGLLAIGAMVAPVPPAILLGDRLVRGRSAYARFLVGYAIVVAAALVPLVGRWVLVAVVILGLGAWLRRDA